MTKKNRSSRRAVDLDALIEEITVDAEGDDEQLWAFRQAFEENVIVPCAATVIGEPVQVMRFEYDGNARRGLTATCRRADDTKHRVAVIDLAIPPNAPGGHYLAAYRKWMGLTPVPSGSRSQTRRAPASTVVPMEGPLEIVVLSVREKTARCRLPGSDSTFTFRASRPWELAPGEIAAVRPAKQWTYAGRPYLSGAVDSTRVDAKALGLVPLRLEEQGLWKPAEHYWGEEGEPIEEWAKPIIARGPRRVFEMEQVLPGADPDDAFSDPITESNDRKASGDRKGAYRILMDLCEADLRCLDAHAHLGNFVFDRSAREAIRHYEVGFRIGELSLSEGFDALLPWGWIDNRPFLRCMHGFGLCLWRLERFDEAARIFDRMLWLNPTDNQGARALIGPVRARISWDSEWS
jgi:hypothetical protein